METEKVVIENAKIESTFLGKEDHSILTCWLHLTYNGGGQGFGGWTFDGYVSELKRRVGLGFGMEFINQILNTLGVSSWEKLPGTYLRVKRTHSKVIAIGHFLNDKWFSPEEFSREYHEVYTKKI